MNGLRDFLIISGYLEVLVRLFWWCKDEFGPGWMDRDNFINRWTGNQSGYGNFDKLAHFLLHLLIVIIPSVCFFQPILFGIIGSLIWGWGWEWIKDCIIAKTGASKFDLIANHLGMILGVLILWKGAYVWT